MTLMILKALFFQPKYNILFNYSGGVTPKCRDASKGGFSCIVQIFTQMTEDYLLVSKTLDKK